MRKKDKDKYNMRNNIKKRKKGFGQTLGWPANRYFSASQLSHQF